ISTEGSQSNAYKMLSEYLDAHVYGEFKIDVGTFSVGSWDIDNNKLVDGLMKYTAITSLGLNLFSGTSNVIMGTLMNGIEANSSFFFSSKDFKFGVKEYGKLLPQFLKDASSRFTTSEVGLWMDAFDLFQEFNENGEPL